MSKITFGGIMFRNGTTPRCRLTLNQLLIALVIVLVIVAFVAFYIAIVAELLMRATGIGATEYDAKLVDKWTEVIDYGSYTIYRAQFVKSDEEVVTLESRWYHNDLVVGSYYKIRVFGGSLTGVTPMPEPVHVEAKY